MDNKVKWNCISIILRDWSDNKMINRKCSRCKEITGTLHGGKKLRKNFYVKTVCKRNCEWGNRIITSGRKTNFISFYKNIKNNECDLFNRINFNGFSTGPFIYNLGFDEISISGSELGLISIVMLGSIFQSVLVFCGIWVFILLVETVIKIYEK